MDNPNTVLDGADKEKETPKKTPDKPAKGSGELEELKRKYLLSSEEGIRLARERKELSETNKKLLEETEVLKTELDGFKSSDEIPLNEKELAKKYPEWDDLLDSDKTRIREIERLKVRQDRLDAELKRETRDRIKKEESDRFDKSFQKVLANPAFDLKDKEEEFKEFCYKDENLGNTNLEVLAKSFLFDLVKEKEADKARGEVDGLESGTSGEKQVPPKVGFTAEEARELMKSNPRKYYEMIRDGKFKII